MQRLGVLLLTAALVPGCADRPEPPSDGDVIREPTLGVGTAAELEGTPLRDSPVPTLRAVASTVLARPEVVHIWLAAARDPAAPPPPPSPAIVAALTRELDALVAWDRAGGGVPVGCVPRELDVAFAIHALVHGALSQQALVTEPHVHALLRFGHALAAPGNSLVAVAIGTAITLAAATRVGVAHPLARAPMLTAFGPDPARLVAAAQRDLACTIALARTIGPARPGGPDLAAGPPLDPGWTLQRLVRERAHLGLPTNPGWLAREWRSYAGFWTDTEQRAAAAATLPALTALYRERATAATGHPDSLLVRRFGELLFSRQAETLPAIEDQVALYAKLRAAARQRR